jgi:hypothetical protein
MDQEKKDYQKAVYGREGIGGEKEIGGMRQRYKELLEIQQKSEIILDEYLTDKSYLDYRKVERRKSLSTTSELIKMMKKPPSLDEAADLLEGNPNPMIDRVSVISSFLLLLFYFFVSLLFSGSILCVLFSLTLLFFFSSRSSIFHTFLSLLVGSKAVYFKLVI